MAETGAPDTATQELPAYLSISNLHKSYEVNKSKLEVLRGIDLSIRKGEIFGIIGFSGAGKSTLARCINRLETAERGEITLDGVDILKLDKKQLLEKRRNGLKRF